MDLVFDDDAGLLQHYEGIRVQHNKARGPMKGGLRFHPSMDEDHAAALASLMTWKTAIVGVPFGGGEPFDGPDVITWDADVLIPAALEDAINEGNVNALKADIIVEGANARTTPTAHEALVQRGVLVVPDILANAGGVTGGYFEWVQNIQQFNWDKERVDRELTAMMRKAYTAVSQVAEEHSIDMRTAAFVLAIRRIAEAATARVHTEENIQL